MFELDQILNPITALPAAELALATVVLLTAAIIRGLTGFGFSAIVVSGLSWVLPPAQTVILALFLEISASIHLLPSAWKNIDWLLLGALAVGIGVGTPMGIALLAWMAPEAGQLVISCLVLGFALLILKGVSYQGPRNFSVHGGLGVVSGICNGTAALGGLPIVTFLLSTDTRAVTTRATLIAAFLGTDIYALSLAGGHGLLNTTVSGYALASLPVVIIGITLGQRLFKVASPDLFKTLALILLLGLSVIGIIRSLVLML
ncbi:sulfite exporter TauE/SafE family protein [Desulfogranum mediterraneum]|uniref:sulfite exporter TauE/SafE family protein n=1 Tax=Desulfogranum mediterraneum TaxID=160661 RepID=UPI00041FAC88|nr:sulfite exporter TauE/SafE family protein [Desulfogranum mediterraneum]